MILRDFIYHNARVVVHRETKTEVEASIFPNKHDIEFTKDVFPRREYNEILDNIRDNGGSR